MNLDQLRTEQVNEHTAKIDTLNSLQIAELMNQEDAKVADAVHREIDQIAKLITLASETIRNGGRIFYVGAGTSGRLGVLDASEIPPTFNAPPNQFIGLIAGGDHALRFAIEGAEDDPELGRQDLQKLKVGPKDLVIGLAASGQTPYVGGAVQEAKENGAKTGLISCNKQSRLSAEVDVAVEVEVGPEVIMGSTRLKSGTAQKLVLNMVSTGAMVQNGKVYKNLMVDLQTTNQKLYDRAIRIIQEATGVDYAEAKSVYEAADKHVKTAIVSILTGDSVESSRDRLNKADGRIRQAIAENGK